MNKLLRFYNNNRYIVWIVVLSIVAIVAIIHILDNTIGERNNNIQNENTVNIKNNYNYSVITEKEIKQDVSDVIKNFIEYCNNGKKEEAYNLLSKECKETLYPNLESFTEKYYNKIFTETKSYSYQAWISQNSAHTFKINFTENMLITGNASKTSIEDYYTVVKDNNNEYKLNINKFIGNKIINRSTEHENIIIYAYKKSIYMNYEIYSFEIVNNTMNTVKLDNVGSTDNVYIEDNNNKKYYWLSHEFSEEDISFKGGRTSKIDIKFYKEYKMNSEDKNIVFENIKLNNEIFTVNIEM